MKKKPTAQNLRTTAARIMHSLVGMFCLLLAFSHSARAGAYEDMERAMIGRNTPAVLDLLKRGVAIDTVNPQGDTLLIQAVREDIPELFEALLKRRPRLDLRNRNGETAISIAAYLGKLDYVQKLAEAGARLDFPGWPPLAYAAFNNQPEVLEYLINKGANINAKTDTGATALNLAARNGHTDIVKLLLKHRADLAIADQHQETPLDVAQKAENNEETVKLLRAAGAPSGKDLKKDGEDGKIADKNAEKDSANAPAKAKDPTQSQAPETAAQPGATERKTLPQS